MLSVVDPSTMIHQYKLRFYIQTLSEDQILTVPWVVVIVRFPCTYYTLIQEYVICPVWRADVICLESCAELWWIVLC